jgi:non-specific serine/threonine protein kinase
MAPAVLPTPPTNLPRSLNSFVGRQRELAELRQLLPHTRLLTLWGPPGSGKTRLACELDALVQFPDGVCFVNLETIFDPSLVPHAVAAALSLREDSGRPPAHAVMERIGTAKLLLVLDTCEHLIDATAGLAEALLSACPNLVVVATSRQFLGIPSETVVHVPPLSLPEAGDSLDVDTLLQSDSVRLFVERAACHNRSFALTEQTAESVAEVCRGLDGLPLAIELAARMVALPLEQLATRLDERFRLLVGGSRTAHWRHRSLQACVDWTYELLESDERQLFERLSVFVGGFGLEAAEAICGADGLRSEAVLGLLRLLVEKSLVNADVGALEARYRLLETLRQHAWERLMASGQAEATLTRHAAYYLAFAAQAAQPLHGPAREVWLDRLERDHGNVRAALRWLGDKGKAQTREMTMAALRAHLGDEAFETTWATGRAMSADHMVSYAQTALLWVQATADVNKAASVDPTLVHGPMSPGELASSRPNLTPRELEILQLIASGLSNREIAGRLVLSVRTVERHITNLYGKIAVRGKAGATAYALHHGLATG